MMQWILLPFAASVEGDVSGNPIYTYYEGGRLLEKTFEILSTLLYGDAATPLDQTFTACLRIALTIGAFSSVCMAFFKMSLTPIIRNFLLCSFVLTGVLLVPTTQVRIVDFRGQSESQAAMRVPFFLGHLASLSSRWVHHLHGRIASKKIYPWIDRMAQDKHPFHLNWVISSGLGEDLKTFCRECVFRDLGLGLYTKQELENADDLISFLQDNRSSIHGMMFYQPEGKMISCNETMKKLSQRFEDEMNGKTDPYFSKLFKIKDGGQEAEERSISQRIAAALLREQAFALSPGVVLKPNVMSDFRTSFCLTIFGLLEAVIVFCFPFALLLSLISFGMQMIFYWLKLFAWMSIWPLFYPIIDLLLQAIWMHRKGAVSSFTLAHADRLSFIYQSMEFIAFIALLFIPVLSWLMIKGAFHQAAHITSSMQETASSSVKMDCSEGSVLDRAWMGMAASPPCQSEAIVASAACGEGFQGGVQEAKEEDRNLLFQRIISSVDRSVKDAGDQVVGSIDQAVQGLACSPKQQDETEERMHRISTEGIFHV